MQITKKEWDAFSQIFESIAFEAKETDTADKKNAALNPDGDKKSDSKKDKSAKEKEPKDDIDVAEPDDIQDPDIVMKKPAGAAKILSGVNAKVLASLVKLPLEHQPAFRSALQTLKQKEPKLSPQQSVALALAFNHLQKRFGKHLSQMKRRDADIF